MENADDDGLAGELIDVSGLDLEELLAVDAGPLAQCIRHMIDQSRREGYAVAGFEAFIGGEGTTDVA